MERGLLVYGDVFSIYAVEMVCITSDANRFVSS